MENPDQVHLVQCEQNVKLMRIRIKQLEIALLSLIHPCLHPSGTGPTNAPNAPCNCCRNCVQNEEIRKAIAG